MVVAPEPLAAKAGVEILGKGGNAIDAAIAAGFVQGVVNPMLCGIGGSGLLFVHHALTNRTFLIDCSCTVGSSPVPKSWEANYIGRSEAYGRYILSNEENQFGYKSIMIPGLVLGAWEAFQMYGSRKVTWEDVIQPAIQLAFNGFKVYPYIARFWLDDNATPGYPSFSYKIKNSPEAKLIYGIPKKPGETFVQKDYGETLQKLALNGGLDFYEGEIGNKIKGDFKAHGALITNEDISEYNVPETEAIIGHYRGYEIRAAVSGCSSSPQIIAMLQILEGFDLKALGHNSAAYIDLVSRVMRASFLDHLQLKGDPPFSVAMSLLKKYTSLERASYWQKRIAEENVTGPEKPTALGSDTTHVSVIDEEGSAVSWTHTLGSLGGSGVITQGLGFLYNNLLGHFNPIAGYWDSILPGKRGGGGAPIMLFKDGKPVMVIGAPGGSRIFTAVVQVVLNVIDHGMTMGEAVNASRFHSEEKNIIFIEPDMPISIEHSLSNMNYSIQRSAYMSRVQAIWIDPVTKVPSAGADPRGGGGQAIIA